MKMIEGCNFQANVKTAETSFWASPNHLLCNVDERTLMKHAPDSLANAFANRVFPSRWSKQQNTLCRLQQLSSGKKFWSHKRKYN